VAKILIARRSNLSNGKPIRCSPDRDHLWMIPYFIEVTLCAREVVRAWHEVARLDGPERFYEALEKLGKIVGKDEP
jgi:hypothetical protein